MTWVTQGPLSFVEIGQGVTIGVGLADAGQPAFVQVSYREEVRADAVDVSMGELQGLACEYAAVFFEGLAAAARAVKS
jgi:hypothetical protein